MRHVWIVEVRNPRDDYPRWEPLACAHETREAARDDTRWQRIDRPEQYRVRKYTPEKS